MNKRILGMIVTLVLFFGCGAAQVFATDAKVTASLSADKKTVSSSYVVFSPSSMYGETYSSSKYPIKYQTLGRNTSLQSGTAVASFTVSSGSHYSSAVSSNYNMHKIVLKGWNIDTAVKGCIGYGYVE